MSAGPALEGDRHAAVVRAFRLIHDIQTLRPGAIGELATLSADALERGWDEVVRAGLFGEVVTAWITRDEDVSAAVARLVDESAAHGDDVMLAVGLALRSDQGFSGDDPSGAENRIADIARAVVLLEQVEGRPIERITAHTACGIALGNRWLFALGDEQYEAALDIGEAEPPGTLDFLLAPIMFNLAEAQVSWASILRQLGDDEGVAERSRGWSAAAAAATSFTMAESWRVELDALGLILGAIAGEDSAPEARRLLGELGSPDGDDLRTAGLLTLAIALADASAGREDAAAMAESAIGSVDPDVHPHVHDLALYLAATIEAGGATGAGLRYAKRQLEQHWANRLSSLGAVQSRIQAERLSTERELLSKHARLDDLTGIGNRRALEQYLEHLQLLGVGTIALILLDIDAFKEVNDRHGHLAGDAVLTGVARVLEEGIRPVDLAVRLGGDEFAVVLADADLDAAFGRAFEFLTTFDLQSFDELSSGLVVALSAGVASGAPQRLAELRAQADTALYRAKAGGGEQVVRSRVARSVVEPT